MILSGALLAACSSFQPSTLQSSPRQVLVELFYTTDRHQNETASTLQPFSNDRGELSFGYCQVAINTVKNNRTAFSDHKAWVANGTDQSTRDAKLHLVSALNFDEMSRRLSQHNQSSNDKSALVYIHGYAKSFEDSAENLARFVYQINYRGTPILYSWPSKGNAAGYNADVTTLDWSSKHLETVLTRLSEETNISTIHIVAHSLGNRAMLKALTSIAKQLPNGKTAWRFGELILLAPDVDKGRFARDWAPALQKSPSRVTLYLTSQDFPLRVSNALNQYPRLGDSRFPPLVYGGIESIDVSDAVTLFNGHSYFRKDKDVLTDLHYLINQRKGADERPNLIPAASPEGYYWRLQPLAVTQEPRNQ